MHQRVFWRPLAKHNVIVAILTRPLLRYVLDCKHCGKVHQGGVLILDGMTCPGCGTNSLDSIIMHRGEVHITLGEAIMQLINIDPAATVIAIMTSSNLIIQHGILNATLNRRQ